MSSLELLNILNMDAACLESAVSLNDLNDVFDPRFSFCLNPFDLLLLGELLVLFFFSSFQVKAYISRIQWYRVLVRDINLYLCHNVK